MSDSETTVDSWYETTRAASRDRGKLTFELDIDVCVVGAGLAGLTVAREIARRGWSVAVLEAGRVAWAASGRNSGFVLPGFHEDEGTIVERIGLDHARQLYALSKDGVDYVRRTIEETGMPGVDPVPGWLHVSKTDDDDTVRRRAERLRWTGAEVEAWPAARVREALPNPRYFGALHYRNAFHIHPLNYALGLAEDAEKAGVRIFEETPALSIDAGGVRKRIDTPDARVRAATVVLAANVHLGELMPQLAATLLPITTYVMVTEPIPALNEVIRYAGGISDTDRADNHYRVIDGNRLQWGGRVRLWDAEPRFIARSLVGDIKRNFPALGEVAVAHLWRGTLGRAIHRMPQVGQIEPGLWVASGFGGHGLNTTAMAGELIARGIVENDETWRLFAPYELVWAGGKIGRAIAQGLYWGSRPVARVEQELARYREKARERNEARKAVREAARAAARAQERAQERGKVQQAAALGAIADVAEAEQRAQGDYVAPVTPDDRAAHLEAPAPAKPKDFKPKDFGRRKRGPKKPKG
jgi:glycine/D-amino acid oxidase-like deaminating enzyme